MSLFHSMEHLTGKHPQSVFPRLFTAMIPESSQMLLYSGLAEGEGLSPGACIYNQEPLFSSTNGKDHDDLFTDLN